MRYTRIREQWTIGTSALSQIDVFSRATALDKPEKLTSLAEGPGSSGCRAGKGRLLDQRSVTAAVIGPCALDHLPALPQDPRWVLDDAIRRETGRIAPSESAFGVFREIVA